jgi:hypothetical protein
MALEVDGDGVGHWGYGSWIGGCGCLCAIMHRVFTVFLAVLRMIRACRMNWAASPFCPAVGGVCKLRPIVGLSGPISYL